MHCFVGRAAARDVYPIVLAELERHPAPGRRRAP
jgi:hypothetical protein